MITHEQYMADSAKLHHAYYLEIARAAGVRFSDPKDIARFREALTTDKHMNNIPLAWWDARAMGLGHGTRQALRERGTFYSMAIGVCILKAAARDAVDSNKED